MILGLVAVAAAVAYSGAVVWSTLNKYTLDVLYTWHPLAASAFFVLAILGITTSQAAQKGSHKARITNHGYIMVAATLTALATNTIIYMHKESNGKPHLTSWHGIMGATTTGLWMMLQVSGGLAWYFPSLITKAMPLVKAYVQHGVFGTLAFGVLIAAHSLALAGSYQGYRKGSTEWWALAGLLALVAASVLGGAGKLLGRAQRAFNLGGKGGAKKKAQ